MVDRKKISMEVVYCLIGVIFGVLNLILFFKIWGMTNDVKELKYALLEEIQKKYIQAPSADAVQGMKSELSKLEEQDMTIALYRYQA